MRIWVHSSYNGSVCLLLLWTMLDCFYESNNFYIKLLILPMVLIFWLMDACLEHEQKDMRQHMWLHFSLLDDVRIDQSWREYVQHHPIRWEGCVPPADRVIRRRDTGGDVTEAPLTAWGYSSSYVHMSAAPVGAACLAEILTYWSRTEKTHTDLWSIHRQINTHIYFIN